ncbi:N-alpha-acetyltransferase 40, partial [Corvus brachyrhynchos]
QRKSSKAKEKKQRRLEERAAMAAVCAKVEAANKLQDPLEAFPVFKKYDRNGLNVSIECRRVSGLEPSTLDWAFELTKANMQTLRCCWQDFRGVQHLELGREESHPRNHGGGWLCSQNSGVCPHEIQQLMDSPTLKWVDSPTLQSPGFDFSPCTQMKKVMLTVFKHNHGAYQFFREALQFEVDAPSPSVSGCCGD